MMADTLTKPPTKSNRKVADRDTPPGATSATTPLGIATNDPDARPGALHEVNEHGVVENPEEVAVPLPKECKGHAKVLLANLEGGWRCNFEYEVGESYTGGLPGPRGPKYPSRSLALLGGSNELLACALRDQEQSRNTAGSQHKRASKAVKAIEAWQQTLGGDASGTPAAAAGESVPAANPQPAKVIARGVQVAINAIERHPINRHPAKADVEARAKSLAEDQQLDDCEVRSLGRGKYQMLSGETRLLAAKSIGWTGLRCTVIECDDAEAARRVALHNAQRKDLNPIEKAQLIESLCTVSKYTREQAARHVNLESAAAASNLVRLLKLPKVWQDRVISGELKESYARLLTPVVEIPAVMKQLDEDFRSDDSWAREYWTDRERLEEAVEEMIEQETERVEGSHLHPDEIEANRKQLGIVKVTVRDGYGPTAKKKEIEVATNVKLFRELSVAAAAKQQTAKAKQVGEEPTAKAKPKSKADLERAAKERAGQLARAVDAWRENVLRDEIAAAIRKLKPSAKWDARLLKLVFHFLVQGTEAAGFEMHDRLRKLLGVKGESHYYGGDVLTTLTAGLAGSEPAAKLQEFAIDLCAWQIGGDFNELERWAPLSQETLWELFAEWGCDFTAAWQRLYKAKDQAIVDFYELHRKQELLDLASAEGDYLAPTLDKAAMVRILSGMTTPPPVPKCLLPPTKLAPKAKAGKKGR